MSDTDLQTADATAGSQSEEAGEQNEDWVAELDLDDATRQSIRKTTYKSPADLAKGYIALQAKLGKTVQIPGDDATEEQRREFLKKLGMPDDPEGYELPKPELPAGVTYDEAFASDFRAAALKGGLSKTQARELFSWYNQYTIDRVQKATEQSKTAMAKTIEVMQSEWGDNYDAEYNLTMRAVDKFGGQDLKDSYNATGRGNDPAEIRAWNKVAHAVGEDSLVGGEEPGGAAEREPGVLDYPSMKDVKPLPG